MRTKDYAAKILKNKLYRDKYFHLVIQSPGLSRAACPGNFAMLKVNSYAQPLLRRPLSIHGAGSGAVEFLYETIGQGTKILSERKVGDKVSILGPLGNGFNLGLPDKGYQPVLVAGGMGVAPLLFLAKRLAKHKPKVFIGGRTKDHVLCEKQFKNMGCDVKISTDDGSAGFCGRVTQLLEQTLATPYYLLPTVLYACGPKPMLQEIARLAGKYNVPAEVSLEAHMACGIGACLGCVVQTTQGYKRVCKDGPVFNAKEIIWSCGDQQKDK